MSVDINNLGPGGVRDRSQTEARDDRIAPKRGDEVNARARPSDVELSEDAKSLARAADGGASAEFDEARVEAIRAAIAEGRYPVDPARLAERFISLESELNQ